MAPKQFGQGRWGKVVLATAANGTCPVADFIDQLPERDQIKLATLLKRFADSGPIRNPEKFKKIEDGLFEFKCFQVRVLCFMEGRTVILTNGCIKKRDELDRAEIQRARRIKAEHNSKVLSLASTKGTQGLKKL